jgi:hypothetical protein
MGMAQPLTSKIGWIQTMAGTSCGSLRTLSAMLPQPQTQASIITLPITLECYFLGTHHFFLAIALEVNIIFFCDICVRVLLLQPESQLAGSRGKEE